jgi:acetoin utilization protein AcuB
MIVRDIMTTKLVTIEPDDTLSHAANLLRQYQFHHLPVVRKVNVSGPQSTTYAQQHTVPLFEGLLTSQDIELAAALADQNPADGNRHRPWQERKVLEVMHRDALQVSPITSVGAAAQLLVERGQNCLPVVEYSLSQRDTTPLLVGLLTRSDLLLALASAMGASEPGMELVIFLPIGSMAPLAETLNIATTLYIQIRSIIVAPLKDGVPRTATLRVGTINPSPLLLQLKTAGIQYAYAHQPLEGKTYA